MIRTDGHLPDAVSRLKPSEIACWKPPSGSPYGTHGLAGCHVCHIIVILRKTRALAIVSMICVSKS